MKCKERREILERAILKIMDDVALYSDATSHKTFMTGFNALQKTGVHYEFLDIGETRDTLP